MAVIAYFVCRSIAALEIVTVGPTVAPLDVAGRMFFKVLASFGQYFLPLIFLVGAVASAIARRNRSVISKAVSEFSPLPPRPYQPEPARSAPTNVSDQHGADIYPMWTADLSEVVSAVPINTTSWSKELLLALEWKRFEIVCGGLFDRLGFTTRLAAAGADGGVDIHLFKPPADQPVVVVQWKAWTGSSKVGVRYIRELHGVMASQRITDGIFATTAVFSDDAKAWARANHIDLMDGDTILRSIATLSEEQQASLLQLATAGDYTTPTCPSCAVKMIRRSPQSGGKSFWGCVNFPRCRSIINIAKA